MVLSKLSSSVSRRRFLHFAGVAAAAPILTEANLAWAAQQATTQAAPRARRQRPVLPEDAVLINANENPLGPCEAACQAIASIAPKGGRYDIDGETAKLTKTFASQNGLREDYVAVYAGSSEPLHYTVLAFTSPTRGFITADPSYEAGMMAAMASKAKIYKVPLKADYSHDLKAMVAADPKAGVIYVCNPNNPPAPSLPKKRSSGRLRTSPPGRFCWLTRRTSTYLMHRTCCDMVAADKDLIVLRTFSKVYGMAGIRCGLALGRPDLLARLQPYGMNAMPITGSAAANVSLLDPDLVPKRKKIIADTRNDTFAFLETKGYKFVPSHSNCFMIDTGREGKAVIAAMQEKNVYIGRTWPVWPNYVRVSVGTPAEMAKFKIAFAEVMSEPPMAARLANPFADVAYPYLS